MKDSLYKKIIFTLLAILIIFSIWGIFAKIKDNDMIYPTLQNIFECIFEELGKWENIKIILLIIPKVLLVVLISLGISLLLGLLYYLLPSSIYFFRPFINILKVAPFAAIAVYIIMAVSRKIASNILSFLVVFPIMIEGVISSIDNVDKSLKDDLKLLNNGELNKFFNGYVPLIMPGIIVSFLQSFGLGLKSMIMGEYLCSTNNSLGGILYSYKSVPAYDYILAWVIIIVVVVALIDLLIRVIGKKVLKY